MARRRRPRGFSRAASGGWPKAPSGICEHLQLKDRFKKSLSMSGEVRLLAGDRVVSHERSRPADLSPRRQDFWSRHARPYSPHCCGCVSWCALLPGDHCCRKALRTQTCQGQVLLARPARLLLGSEVQRLRAVDGRMVDWRKGPSARRLPKARSVSVHDR